MFGRATTYDGNPAKIDEAINFTRTKAQPTIAAMPGNLGLGMWCNRESGHVIVVTAWADQAALDASTEAVVGLREEGASILGAPAEVMTYEPVVMEQTRGDEPGFWTRAVLLQADTALISRGVDIFRTEIAPEIRKLPGCTGVMLGVNRETGLGVAATTFDSRAALDATRDSAAALRDASAARTGAMVRGVTEDEVTIVGIRGPEIPGQRTIELPTETSV